MTYPDTTSHWELIATLQPDTRLQWLARHKEVHPGPKRPAEELPPEHAVWVAVPKSWKDLGFDLPDLPPSKMASPVGPIPEDGGAFLPFLIRYRTIVEQLLPERHAAEVATLRAAYPQYAAVLNPKGKRHRSKPTSEE